MRLFHQWLGRNGVDQKTFASAVDATFSSDTGQIVWNHLMDIYFSVCDDNHALALAGHNGMRALIKDLIEKRDMVHNPNNYKSTEVET